ncbi:MAG: hypothetical protein GY750_01530 [Lentisphaerae bacterium]|nr:hypothetical protein [Lentisphaerota bacterium]MCP4100101.1 hypothetical protein [Lentisphaerota bacterium]
MSVTKCLLATAMACAALGTFSMRADAGEKEESKKVFDTIASKLESGGTCYSVNNYKFLFKNLAHGFAQAQQMVQQMPMEGAQKGQVMLIMSGIKSLVHGLGINEIKGIGYSSVITKEPAKGELPLFRNRMYYYLGQNSKNCILWDLNGTKNRDFTSLKMLPKSTVCAASWEFYPDKVWVKIKGILSSFPFPPAAMLSNMAEAKFSKKTGLQLPVFLKGIGGIGTFVITAGETKDNKPTMCGMAKIPSKNKIILTLFKNLYGIKKLNKGYQPFILKGDEIKANITPKAKTPKWICPLLRQEGDYIYIASNEAVLTEIKETETKGNGLITTPEFKQIAKGIQLKGTSYLYCSELFVKTISDIIATYDENNQNGHVVTKILFGLAKYQNIFTVVSLDKDGILVTSSSNNDLSEANSGGTQIAVASTAIMAGMLLPALNSAREKARRISCTSRTCS